MLITPTKAISNEDAKLKELPLEARHSICLELAKKKRLKVPSSIFIPKEVSRKLRYLRMPKRQEALADRVISTKLSTESIRKKLLNSAINSKYSKTNISSNPVFSLKNNSNNNNNSNNSSDKNTMLHPESFPIVRQTVTSEKIRCVVEKLRDRNEEIDLTGTATAPGVACIERAPVRVDMPNLEQICCSEEPKINCNNKSTNMNNNCLSQRNNDDANYGPPIDTSCVQCEPCRNDDEEISFYGQQQYPQYNANQKDCIKTENYYADDCDDGCDADGDVDGDNRRVGYLQPCGAAGVENYGYLDHMINKSFKDDCSCMPMNENVNDIMIKNTQELMNYNAANQNYYAEYTRERNNGQIANNCLPTPMPPLCISPPAPLCPPQLPLCPPVTLPPPPPPPPPIQNVSEYLNFATQQQQREAALSNCAAQQQQQQREAAIASFAAQQQREAIMNCATLQQRQALMACPAPQTREAITTQPKERINCPPFLCPPPPPNCNGDELRRVPIYRVPSPNRFQHNFNINCNSILPRMPCDQNNNQSQLASSPALPAAPPTSYTFRLPSTSSSVSTMPIPYYIMQQQQQDEQQQQAFLMPTLAKPQAQILQELKQQHLQQQSQSQSQPPSQSSNYNMSFERNCWHAREAARARMSTTSSMCNAAAYRPCSAQRMNWYQAAHKHPQQQQQRQELQQPCDVQRSFLDCLGGPFKSEKSTRQQQNQQQQQQQQQHPGGFCCSNHLMHSNNSLNGIGMCHSDMQFSESPYYALYSDYRDAPYTSYNPYALPNLQVFSSVPAYSGDSNMWHPYHVTPPSSQHFLQR